MAHIIVLSPAPPRSRTGNNVTAQRWAKRLRELGHRVRIAQQYRGEACDVLVALHARKSAAGIRRFHVQHPEKPLIVALTGTDLYHDLRRSAAASRSLELATRLVLLQPLGRLELPPRLRRKAAVILQSALPAGRITLARASPHFDVVVLENLRPVKDPLRTALASRRLPRASRLRVVHAGAALSPAFARRARLEMRRNPRYRWLGEVPYAAAQRLLARAQILVLSSRLEGGANVVSEAIVNGVPILASRIPGSVGLLGPSYPGYFPTGDTAALAALMRRAETEPRFRHRLRSAIRRLAPRFHPARERRAWKDLLDSIA